MSGSAQQYWADIDASGHLIGQGLYRTGIDASIPSTAIAIDQNAWLHWSGNRPLAYTPGPNGSLGSFRLPLPPAPTAAQLAEQRGAALKAKEAAILAAGVLFQTAAMAAASPAQPPVAFPLDVIGFARLTAAETSATRSPTVWIDGSPIPDVTGRPWPMSNADILALSPKASTYYQKVGTYAAQLLSQIEAGQNPDITAGWPSNA